MANERIKVRATKDGYYNHKRIKPGEVFFIEKEEHFSDAHREENEEGQPIPAGWMEKVESTDKYGEYVDVNEDGETVTKKVKKPGKHPRAGKTSPDDEGVEDKKDFGRKTPIQKTPEEREEDGDVI